MKIFVIANGLPTPPSGGGAHRFFNICMGLAERGELIAATRAQSISSDAANNGLFTRTLSLPQSTAKISLSGRLKHKLMFGCHLRDKYWRPEYLQKVRDEIDRLIDLEQPDVIYVSGLSVSQYVCWKPRSIPVITDLCDCATLLYKRQAEFAASLREKIGDLIEAQVLLSFELEICRFSSYVFFVSDIDRLELEQHRPEAKLVTVPLIVDGNYFSPNVELENPYPESQAFNIVFSGVMSYLPNKDGAIWFANEIFPRIKAQLPDAQFWIVGLEPPREVIALGELDGVHVTGTVDDIRPYVRHASVVVSPLRTGAGVKTKILTALALQTKVICTPLSVEGTSLKDGVEVLIAKTPEEFERGVLAIFRSPEEAAKRAERGREAVLRNHSIKAQNDVLWRILDDLGFKPEDANISFESVQASQTQ